MTGLRSEKAIKLIAVVCVAVVAMLLTGCGASISVYDYTENGVRYNEYEVTIDNAVVAEMERTATTDRYGETYTVASYLESLFGEYGYSLVDASKTDVAYTAAFRKAIAGEPELYRVGNAVEFVTETDSGAFVRTYTASAKNPFDGVREKFDALESGQAYTVLDRIKFGVTAHDEYNEPVIVFPSVYTAFPYLDGMSPDGLRLDYSRNGSSRMKSSGAAIELGNKTSKYTFSRYFDGTDNVIVFEYKRPVPYGWYAVAVAVGGIVLAIFAIVVKRKRAEAQTQDSSEPTV